MKALVVGYGSIGSRHARVLKELGCSVGVVSSRKIDFQPSYIDLKEAIERESPEYIVIANRTDQHYDTFLELGKLGFKGRAMIEKPLFSHNGGTIKTPMKNVFVAYNLRFHPLLQKLKKLLQDEKLISVQGYVGKYLPQWRTNTDYKKGYSARKNAGGGALRDLSHELDYLNWMLGGWVSLAAAGGHFSSLDIDSDDVFALLIKTRRCPVVLLQMNYLDRLSRREIIVNTDAHTFKVDIIAGILQEDGKNSDEAKVSRDYTYQKEHEAVLKNQHESLCSLEEGLETLRMIDAAEKAVKENRWVNR
jgi:predicted dehydrogenase